MPIKTCYNKRAQDDGFLETVTSAVDFTNQFSFCNGPEGSAVPDKS